MWDLLLDALLDTLKLMPWLLIMHVLIEVFEYHAVSKIKLNKALKGPLAPLIGGVLLRRICTAVKAYDSAQ